MRPGMILWIAALGVVAAAGFFGGWLIKGGGSPDFPFDTKAPAYAAADVPGGRSRAGFTGFSDTGGLSGFTIVAGKVANVSPDTLTISTAAGTDSIRLRGQEKLRILQPFASSIQTGTTVAITRKAGTEEAAAVLVVLDP